MIAIVRVLLLGLFVFLVVTIAAFVYLEWWQALLVSFLTFVMLIYGARYLIRYALARLGKMKLKEITPFVPGEVNSAQILISHPQYTGMQMDQLTRNWIPPDYINSIKISYAGKPILGIVKVEKGTVTLCWADQPGTAQRPKDFSSTKENKNFLIVMKKAK